MFADEVQVRILQISDLHFGPPYLPKVGEAVLRIAPTLEAHAIVISGDLTQRAKLEQFKAARDFIDRLPPIPRLVVPGNHDVPLFRVWERWRTPHQLYRKYICDDLSPVLRLPGAVIVGIDSTSPFTALSNGRITQKQLSHCINLFHGTPNGAAKIVVAHHHFAPAPDAIRDTAMQQAKRAMRTFDELKVDLILGGHLHRAYIGNSLDFYPGLNRDRGIIICQSGTTTSRRGRGREREKNSLNVIEIGRRTIQISHYMYFSNEDAFEPTSRHTFRRGTADLPEPPES
jgi:3',5'-cyclic AMP phosphodiesterase CpdA